MRAAALPLSSLLLACGSGAASAEGFGGGNGARGGPAMAANPPAKAEELFGAAHAGQYHLGPVDFAESEWHNACAPAGGYRAELRAATGLGGEWLAGVASELSDAGGVCDACISIETAQGRSIVARVVSYGTEQDPNDIDVSPSVYEAIHAGEYPRSMSWRFARCPDTGPLQVEYQSAANPYWTSLWIRAPRVPVTRVEVRNASHSSYTALRRGSDGTLTDDGGFGQGAFSLRITGMDGRVFHRQGTAGEWRTDTATPTPG